MKSPKFLRFTFSADAHATCCLRKPRIIPDGFGRGKRSCDADAPDRPMGMHCTCCTEETNPTSGSDPRKKTTNWHQSLGGRSGVPHARACGAQRFFQQRCRIGGGMKIIPSCPVLSSSCHFLQISLNPLLRDQMGSRASRRRCVRMAACTRERAVPETRRARSTDTDASLREDA